MPSIVFLPCFRLWARTLPTFNLHNNPMKLVLLALLYRWENWGTESSNNRSKVTLRAEGWTQVVSLQVWARGCCTNLPPILTTTKSVENNQLQYTHSLALKMGRLIQKALIAKSTIATRMVLLEELVFLGSTWAASLAIKQPTDEINKVWEKKSSDWQSESTGLTTWNNPR